MRTTSRDSLWVDHFLFIYRKHSEVTQEYAYHWYGHSLPPGFLLPTFSIHASAKELQLFSSETNCNSVCRVSVQETYGLGGESPDLVEAKEHGGTAVNDVDNRHYEDEDVKLVKTLQGDDRLFTLPCYPTCRRR